jgi:hypothetical protein
LKLPVTVIGNVVVGVKARDPTPES